MANTRNQPEPTEPRETREEYIREIIAGDRRGSIRRIVLYLVVAVSGLTALTLDGVAGVIFGGIAVIALLLLGFTDNLA
jgi:hypothetical protein